MKTKLGKMYYATMQKHSRDQQRNCVARFIDFERMSTYVIESFDNRMVSLFQVTNIENLWLQPIAYHIDEKLRLYMFYPEAHSLFQLLHSSEVSEFSLSKILKNEPQETKVRIKYEIAFQISRILLTIENLSTL